MAYPADFQLPADARRIVVAMSGGVDSSVVAALAHATGVETIGVTLQLYDHGEATGRSGACCAGRDIRDARAVCDRLGIAHYVFDHESAFRSRVIDQFADDYLSGRTPIPCVQCNMGPKFTDLLGLARGLGADCLATGHYVRRILGADGPELHRGADPARDQSYFLFATTRDQLDYLRFPLGGLPKSRVREIAAELGLGVAAKPDSQDICFVPDGDYTALVRKLRPEAAAGGDIVDLAGRRLGSHRGVIHYTVGQRRGLELGGTPEPLYVVRIDADARRVVVGPPRRARGVRGTNRSHEHPRPPRWPAHRQGTVDGQARSRPDDRRTPRLRLARIRSLARPGRSPLRRRARPWRRLDRGNGIGAARGMIETIADLQRRMDAAATALDFETARLLRDQISLLRGVGEPIDSATLDPTGLTRQRPGAMGLGTSQQRMTPPEGWVKPVKPDPMTTGRSRRGKA